MQWISEQLLIAYKHDREYFIGVFDNFKCLYKIKLLCEELTSFEVILRGGMFCTCEDGAIKIYNVPQNTYVGEVVIIQPIEVLKLGDRIKLSQAKVMQFGAFNMIAATDYFSNIFVFKDGQLCKTYLNAHSKLITDIAWIFTFDSSLFQD